MKFCIVWKEDKSRQNDTIKSLWNSPTQMTLSHKYDLEEYSPSFWILKQNSWSEMRYPVDNFDLAVLCWDEKNSLFAFLPWYNMFDSIHPTPAPPNPSPPKQKYCITFVFNVFWVLQLSQEKLETTLMQNLGNKQGALYLKRCGVGDHPLCPRFQIWRWPVGLNIRTIVSPSKTRRFWEEFVKPSCDN